MERSDEGVRVRRGRRGDVARARTLLPAAAGGSRRERFDRRTFASLANDVYLAEDAAGDVVGVVVVAYYRSLREGRMAAVLDVARVVPAWRHLLDRLIALAEERARRRGCVRLEAPDGVVDAALRTALASRGYDVGERLVGDIGEMA